jgi:hypothetical protein
MHKRNLLLALVLLAAPGCEALWMNEGKVVSVLAAGQVGMFRRQTGQWPQSRNQLIEHGCKDLDAGTLEPAVISGLAEPVPDGCQFFLKLGYGFDLQPEAADLRMVLRDPAGKLVCNLLVIAPPDDGRDTLSPQIKLRTTLFGCPGVGESW